MPVLRSLSRPALLLGFAALLLAWLGRYDLQIISAGAVGLRLDRWTGNVTLCDLNGCRE